MKGKDIAILAAVGLGAYYLMSRKPDDDGGGGGGMGFSLPSMPQFSLPSMPQFSLPSMPQFNLPVMPQFSFPQITGGGFTGGDGMFDSVRQALTPTGGRENGGDGGSESGDGGRESGDGESTAERKTWQPIPDLVLPSVIAPTGMTDWLLPVPFRALNWVLDWARRAQDKTADLYAKQPVVDTGLPAGYYPQPADYNATAPQPAEYYDTAPAVRESTDVAVETAPPTIRESVNLTPDFGKQLYTPWGTPMTQYGPDKPPPKVSPTIYCPEEKRCIANPEYKGY
jgi:hypothetical protein